MCLWKGCPPVMKVTETKGWTTDRRSARRLRLPLIIRWRRGSTVSEAFMDSEDVSSHGIYFLLPKDTEIGLFVESVMVLPTVHARMRRPGRIQRTQPQAPSGRSSGDQTPPILARRKKSRLKASCPIFPALTRGKSAPGVPCTAGSKK
jgi:hypothetical protein